MKLLVSRLRKRTKTFGIEIENLLGESYRISSQKPLVLVYKKEDGDLHSTKEDQRLRLVEEHFSHSWFTSQALANAMNVSVRSASRWLNEWVNQGQVSRKGARKDALFMLNPRESSEKIAG